MRSIRRRGSAATGTGLGRRRSLRLGLTVVLACIAGLALAVSAMAAGPGVNGNNLVTSPDTTPQGYSQPSGYAAPAYDGLGVPTGDIKHVWVITMENHAYESNFTGLDQNDYVSKQLPQAGALLTHYYGTEHSSLGNYLAQTSGQAPITDDQNDCNSYTNLSGSVDTSTTDGNGGQFASAAGPNAPAGDNGCVYPSTVPTLFNQLDANKTSWKVYAQDLSNTGVAGQNAGVADCGAPDATPGATPSSTQATNPGLSASPYYVKGSAVAADQYVAKHNPLPWFQSELGSSDCNSAHLADVMDANDQLYSDLQSESSTPSLSYIVPNNCSNGHDSVCVGNNLSGMTAGSPTNSSLGTPLNSVGGTYAADLFLGHVIPEIMKSPAYSDGGLIIVTWDEAYPQFTYSNDSFANSAVSSATANNSLSNDAAGETLFGRSLNWEPSGPNVPNVQSQVGQQLSGGPGFNEYLDRPGSSTTSPLVACTGGTQQTGTSTTGATASNGYYVMGANGCYNAGAAYSNNLSGNITVSASSTGMVNVPSNSSYYNLVAPNDEGEAVTLPTGITGAVNGSTSTGPFYIGQVTGQVPAALNGTTTDTTAADQYPTSAFQLVDANGNAVSLSATTGSLSSFSITVAGQTPATDPLYDAFDGTNGGGDSGALMLSPYIKGGTVSNTYYNHYSLLRSLEDIFGVSSGGGNGAQKGYTGTMNVSTGVDGLGHLGYAAQTGLATFGTDVFSNSPLDMSTTTLTKTTPAVTSTVNKTVTQTVTQSLPGSIFTVTTPGGTTKVKVVATKVPKLTGLTKGQASQVLASEGLKLGSVKSPKVKSGYTAVVSAANPGAGKAVATGSKVNLTMKLVKG